MSRLRENPPLQLSTYNGTYLRAKMEGVHLLLKWAVRWLADVQDMDMKASLEGLAHAKQIRRTAAALERTFEEAALAEMFHTDQAIHIGDGYTAVMRNGKARKGWRHDQVMAALIDTAVEQMHGKYPYVPEKLLASIVTEAMWRVHKAGRVEWRSTDLRAAGVDPDEFSTSTEDAPTIDLRGEASYATVKPRPRGVMQHAGRSGGK